MHRRTAIALAAAVTAAAVAVVRPLLAEPTTMTAATKPTTQEAVPQSINAGVQVATLPAPAPEDPAAARIYESAVGSIVPVQYTYTTEVNQVDLIFPGIVVDERGLIMVPIGIVSDQIPDEYMRKFKILIPHEDAENDEIPAEFQGRDDRAEVGFVLPKAGAAKGHVWKPIKFAKVSPPLGQTVYSVGLSTKSANYHPFLAKAVVAAYYRGAQKAIQVTGGSLAAPGSPVFLADGTAIGVVSVTGGGPGELLLRERPGLSGGTGTDRVFAPTSEFAVGLENPPSAGRPVPMAYTGLAEMSGLKKEDAAFFGLANKPAIQINDMLPDSPAVKGGLKKKDVIIAVDGKPLERGDLPEELPGILHRTLTVKKPGDTVTFTVIRKKGEPPIDVAVKVEARPMEPGQAARYWSDEIGFGVRQMVTGDRYDLHLKPDDADGVVVTLLKEGGAAGSGGLQPGDMVKQVNAKPVTSLETFKSAFEEFRKAHEHQPIVMLVHRGNGDETIRIEPPQ